MCRAIVLIGAFTIVGCASSAISSPSVVPAFTAARAAPLGIWLAGDTHVHTDHSSDGSLPRQSTDQRLPGNVGVRDQIDEATRNRLDFLALTDHRTYDQHWDPQWSASPLILLPGEEANGKPHAIVLGAIDEIVDGANPEGSAAFRHVQQSIWDAHAQDAVWSVAHPDNGELGANGQPNEYASVLGADVVEVWNPSSNPDAQIDYAENRWNRGFRYGVVGASDNHYRELWSIAGPGKPTTWVFAAERSPRAILDALHDGRTAVSRSVDGPFATIEGDFDGDGVFEAISGDEIAAPPGGGAQLRVRVRNGIGMNVYVYRSPGRAAGVVSFTQPASADDSFLLPVRIDPGQSWYRVEVRSPGELSGAKANPLLRDQLRGASTPIFVTTGSPADPAPESPIPAPAAAADESAVAVEAVGGFAGLADISVANSVRHVLAEMHRDGKASVVYRHLTDSRSDGAVVTLSSEQETARLPKVAAAGLNVWVVWEGQAGVVFRHSADGGATWQAPTQISTNSGTGRAVHPTLALVNELCPVIAWAENSSGAFDIYARMLCVDTGPTNVSASGKTTRAGNTLDTRSARYPASLFPSVAISRSGKIIVAWQDNRFDPDPLWTGHTPPLGQPASGGTDPDNWEILASVREAGASSWQPPIRIGANEDRADRHPSIAVDGTGAIAIAWDSKPLRSSGVNVSIRSSRSSDQGATWSAVQSIGLERAAMSQRPKLGVDADGTVRAVWYDSRSADWRWQVFTAHYDSLAASWSAASAVTGAGNSTWPAISNGVVTFTSDRRAARPQRDQTHEVFVAPLGN